MAKQRGPVASTFSGRVGNVVGAKIKGGEYVTRSYQPAVKNPNTARQQAARFRMKVCSGIAAAFASALNIGYAKASASTKMYPRNMFLQDVLPISGSPISTSGGTSEVDQAQLMVSKQAGIAIKPMGRVVAAAGGNPTHVEISNLSDVQVSGNDHAGVVCVFSNDTFTDVRVAAGVNSSINVPEDMLTNYGSVYVWAFFKIAPETHTEVATDTYPWKYPSNTSGTAYLGMAEA